VKKSIVLLSLVAVLSMRCTKEPQEPKNYKKQLADQLVLATLWFQQSAEMEASYLQAYEWAKFLIDQKLDTLPKGTKAGVILDIDETVLDNSPYEAQLIRQGDQYGSATWKAWTDQARARALPGALQFVNYARSKGVDVFYISNRRENELAATLENLDSLGFPNADAAHVLLMKDTGDKTSRRAAVSEQVRVILYVGDNLTDYSEAFADREEDLGKEMVHSTKGKWLYEFVMLPNPMYGEWEKAIYGNDYRLPDSVKVQRRLDALQD